MEIAFIAALFVEMLCTLIKTLCNQSMEKIEKPMGFLHETGILQEGLRFVTAAEDDEGSVQNSRLLLVSVHCCPFHFLLVGGSDRL